MKNAINAEFDAKLSAGPGTWALVYDPAERDHVALEVCTSAQGEQRKSVAHLDAHDVDHLIEWLQRARAQMESSTDALDALDAPAPTLAARARASHSQLTQAQLQAALAYNNARPYGTGLWRAIQRHVGASADGAPGPKTARKVAEYQYTQELGVDGKVGPGTLGSMNISPIRTLDERAFFYTCRLAINADGAPNAYNPHNTGIDFLANAGRPGKWWGLATDASHQPYVQDASDPNPGYYVSTTALADYTYPRNDPRRYVDSNTIPFIVLPRNIDDLVHTPRVRKGDLAVVARRSHPEQLVYAIYADVGPKKILDPDERFGEGSIALAQALGHDPFVMRRGVRRAVRGMGHKLFFLVFPGSGEERPLDSAELLDRGARVFNDWGGPTRLREALALFQ